MKKEKLFRFRVVWDDRSHTWVVARTDLEGDYHAHFGQQEGCYKLIDLYHKGKQPFKKHYRTAMQRITTQEEWDSFTPKKAKPKNQKKPKHMLKQ